METETTNVRSASVKALVNTEPRYTHRLMIGTPTLGPIRMEWHNAMAGMTVPTNFSSSLQTPIGFRTDDAQNLIVHETLKHPFDWLLFIEDDVIVPDDLLLKLRPYMQKADIPLVSGLYHVKGFRHEPMIYRGRGNGPFLKWKPGQKVWADGVPTGCLLVSTTILRGVAEKAETYRLQVGGEIVTLRRVFEERRHAWVDPATGGWRKQFGTSDLIFCDRVRALSLLTAWPKVAAKRYPFLVDTSICCGHIDRESGYVH